MLAIHWRVDAPRGQQYHPLQMILDLPLHPPPPSFSFRSSSELGSTKQINIVH